MNIRNNEFIVQYVKENEDGSADIEVEMGSEVREILFDEGLNFLLIKAALGGTTDQVLTWAERGKQEEEVK